MRATLERLQRSLTNVDSPYGATLGHIRNLCSVLCTLGDGVFRSVATASNEFPCSYDKPKSILP